MSRFSPIEKMLLGVLFLLIAGIGVGTIVTLSAKKPAKDDAVRGAATPPSQGNAETAFFTGIGRLRVPLQKPPGGKDATLIITVDFPYNSSDRAFTNELASRAGAFRSIIKDYFSAMSADDNRLSAETRGEERIKDDLLKQFNARLFLGKIDALYFEEFMLLD